MAQDGDEVEAITPHSRALADLRALRDGLPHPPSSRQLATAVGVSITTVTNWLEGHHFAQQDDRFLKLVAAIRRVAQRQGRLHGDAVAVLDEDHWRRIRADERKRVSDAGRVQSNAVRADRGLLADGPGVLLTEGRYDAFQLGVHHAIELDTGLETLSPLTPYVERSHDEALVRQLAGPTPSRSTAAILVGDSSTGKTRACTEQLRRLDGGWRIWIAEHADRANALLEDLDRIAPNTVIWLDEAQHFFLAPEGEVLAARLRHLLREPTRAPVVVLGTLWPEYHRQLTAVPADGIPTDPHRETRAFLAHHALNVDPFSGAQLEAMRHDAAVDPRLRRAAEEAENGAITQYLAGAPAVIERYRFAPSAARALIDATIDLARLADVTAPDMALVREAAAGYLTEVEWDRIGEDGWDEAAAEALRYTRAPCRGVRGPLTIDRPRGSAASRQRLRLADVVEQVGRVERAGVIPPGTFWDAALRWLDGEHLTRLAAVANGLGLRRWAVVLLRGAAVHPERPHGAGTLLADAADWAPCELDELAAWLVEHVVALPAFDLVYMLPALHLRHRSDLAQTLAVEFSGRVVLDPFGDAIDALRTLLELDDRERAADLAEGISLPRSPVTATQAARAFPVLAALNKTDELRELARRAEATLTSDAPRYYFEELSRFEPELARSTLLAIAHRINGRDPRELAELVAVATSIGGGDQVLAEHTPLRCLDASDQDGLVLLVKGLDAVEATAELDELFRAIATTANEQGAGWLDYLRGMAIEYRLNDRLSSRLPVLSPAMVDATPTTAASAVAGLSREPEAGPELHEAMLRLVDRVEANDPADQLAPLIMGWLGWDEYRPQHSHPIVEALAARPLAGSARVVVWRLAARTINLPQHDDPVEEVAAVELEASAEVVDGMIELLERVGWVGALRTLLAQSPADRVEVSRGDGVMALLESLHRLGEHDQVARLAERAAEEFPVEEARSFRLDRVLSVVDGLQDLARRQDAEALAQRVARTFTPRSLAAYVELLEHLRRRRLPKAEDILLNRGLEETVPLDSTYRSDRRGAATVLALLHEAGASKQVGVLSARLAEQFDLSASGSALHLTTQMRALGRDGDAQRMVARALGTGRWWLAHDLDPELAARYPNGREPDGSASPPWTWTNPSLD